MARFEMPHYTSFVLRLWRVRQGRGWVCRAMLERVSSGERVGFADLPSLVAFLQIEVETTTNTVRNMNVEEEHPKPGDRSK